MISCTIVSANASARRRRTFEGVGSQRRNGNGELPRAESSSRAVPNAWAEPFMVSWLKRCPRSVAPTMSSVRRIISTCASNGLPPANCVFQPSSVSPVTATIDPTSSLSFSRWNAGCARRRRFFQASPSSVRSPAPVSGRMESYVSPFT
jgi:hypothetical protein